MGRKWRIFSVSPVVFFGLALLSTPGSGFEGHHLINGPTVIQASGSYLLTEDIDCSFGNGNCQDGVLSIQADRVTLDLGHHTINTTSCWGVKTPGAQAQITIKNGVFVGPAVSLTASSQGKFIILQHVNLSGPVVIDGANAADILLEDFEYKGSVALSLTNLHSGTARQGHFMDGGLTCTGCRSFSLLDSRVNGPVILGGDTLEIRGNTVYAIQISANSSRVSVTDNRIEAWGSSTGYGIDATSVTDLVIRGNSMFWASSTGIHLVDVQSGIIQENHIVASSGDGIALLVGSGTSERNAVIQNYIMGNGTVAGSDYGLRIEGVDNLYQDNVLIHNVSGMNIAAGNHDGGGNVVID